MPSFRVDVPTSWTDNRDGLIPSQSARLERHALACLIDPDNHELSGALPSWPDLWGPDPEHYAAPEKYLLYL